MRAFIAIEAPEDVRRAVAQAQDKLARTCANVKWVAKQNLHLTLQFLGEIDDAQADRLRALLREIASHHPPFEIEYAGIGTFPRVIWVGCRGAMERLASLAGEVEKAAEECGVPREDRGFTAHLTIGRVKERGPRVRPEPDRAFGRQTVDAFALVRSELTPKGSIYTPLETFRLG